MHQKIHIFLLLLASTAAGAQPAMGGMKEMIVTGGLSSGKTYQVAEHCGASAELLKAYRARFDADLRGGEQLYASLGVNIEAVFLQGRKEGTALFENTKSTPNRNAMCTQTLALVETTARKP